LRKSPKCSLEMGLNLDRIFDALSPVTAGQGQTAYSVGRIARNPGYLVGRDTNNKACLLVAVADEPGQRHAPIRLENLEVEFEVRSRVTETNKSSESIFTVIRCRSDQAEVIHYFFSVAETIIRILGAKPTRPGITSAVAHLARIFQQLLSPPLRPVTGLFGELLLMRQCGNPVRAMTYWRLQNASRFDFTAGDLRLDVKTTTSRARTHTFSYDQCNPPAGTVAVLASLFVERTATGLALGELIDEIESSIAGRTELVLKLRETVAATLGASLSTAMKIRFDEKLAISSLRFFDLRSIPAIRFTLPPGVSDVHFHSDLSSSPEADIDALIDKAPALEDLIPKP
jgi:hypothetical protein